MTRQDQHARRTKIKEPLAEEPVRVEVVDAGPQRFLACVGGASLPLRADAPDGIPRVRDVEFSAWLGQEHVRVMRKLTRGMIATGKFSRDEVLHREERSEGEGGRPARAHWFTREQALLVASQCATPRAWAMTRLMARVFDAVLSRLRPANDNAGPALEGLRAQLETLAASVASQNAEIVSLRAQVQNDVGEVSGAWVRENVLEPLQRIARVLAKSDDRKAVAAARRRLENQVRNTVCFTGKGSSWAKYPRDAHLLRILRRCIADHENEALQQLSAEARARADERTKAEAEARQKQLRLFRN